MPILDFLDKPVQAFFDLQDEMGNEALFCAIRDEVVAVMEEKGLSAAIELISRFDTFIQRMNDVDSVLQEWLV